MIKKNKKIDEYIGKIPPYAKPVLKHLRELIHNTCPDVEEKIQWGFPCFDYRGASMCSLVAYSEHCSLNFWKFTLFNDPKNILGIGSNKKGITKGNLAKIISLKDLPKDEIIIDFIKQAMKFNEDGIENLIPERLTNVKKMEVPDYFQKELNKNPKAKKTFDAFRTSQRNAYMRWIITTKVEETRNNKIKSAMQMLAKGKEWNHRDIN